MRIALAACLRLMLPIWCATAAPCLAAPGDPAIGAKLFLQCRACHAVTAQAPEGVGPNLYGVVGAAAGKRAGYAYSPALSASGLVWTPTNLDRWLTEPTALVPGTKMAFAGINAAAARAHIIAYLATLVPTLSLPELRAKYSDAAGHMAKIDGLDIYYEDEGTGPAILLLHGSACTLRSWDQVAADLRRTYRVIRYDVPGQGLSGPVTDAAAATLQPADIAAGLLDYLGVKQATVIGFSSGGTLGVYLAASRPALVQRLIISNAPADPVSAAQLHPTPAWAAAQAQAKADGFQSPAFWNAFLDFFSHDGTRISPAVRQTFADMNRRTPEPNALALVAKVADHEKAVAAMAQLRGPVLLIWGATDPLLPLSAEAALKAYLSHADITESNLPDVGHFVPMEAPDRFAGIVRGFMQRR